MPRSSLCFHTIISSSTYMDKGRWTSEKHFRWPSVKRFLSIATIMSSVIFNFDVFAKISTNVRIFDFLLLEIIVGMSYLCMDCFIKQYTGRFDCNKYLNPLLKGISYGQFLQTSYFSLVHGAFVVDTVRFLFGALREVPAWAVCKKGANITCIPIKDVILHCNMNKTTAFMDTSAFVHYVDYFTKKKRRQMTSNIFMTAMVWIVTFFLSSITEEAIVKKIFRLTLLLKIISVAFTLLFLLLIVPAVPVSAFLEILDMRTESSWATSMQHVSYTYGIGFLGVYDYGTISSHTMMDTAAVIFMGIITCLDFMRSWILKILYLGMIKCVEIDKTYVINTHNLIYAVLPLTTEFLQCKKIFVMYLYGNITITLMSFETFMVSSMSKFLRYEFRTVKQVYIIGIICAVGFIISTAINLVAGSYDKKYAWQGIVEIDFVLLYLSWFRALIIMWVYGVERFATDIHFWLGFQPTRFWTTLWTILPIILLGFTVNKFFLMIQQSNINIWSLGWISFTLAVVTIIQLKSVATYFGQNDIIGLLKASKLYGPPDIDDRKRRQGFSEITRDRKCRHNCIVIDEWFRCDHEHDVGTNIKLDVSPATGSIKEVLR